MKVSTGPSGVFGSIVYVPLKYSIVRRLDVNFFLLRFDLGLKLHDPMQAEGQRFVLLNRNGGFNKSVFNIAIGYPF